MDLQEDAARALSSLHDFATALQAHAQGTTNTLLKMERRLSTLERLLDPLPPGLDSARVDAQLAGLSQGVAEIDVAVSDLATQFEAHEVRIASLETRVEAALVAVADIRELLRAQS